MTLVVHLNLILDKWKRLLIDVFLICLFFSKMTD